VVGGGTGLVGDPSGKTEERRLLTREQLELNMDGIRGQVARFLDFDVRTNPAVLVNNLEWLDDINMMEFLRDVGKCFTVNYMLAKESVKRRLEQEQGLSFTEFTYMLFQAYDFLVLYDRYKCLVQMGGSDQWGNIVAGIDLIRRLRGERAHGMVFPLVTTAEGVKFGKTEAGTVWLDAELTSPYRFFQYWLNADDGDVVANLKFFTWLPEAAIAELAETVAKEPEQRKAQRKLAQEVTRIVHGESALARAERATEALFGGEVTGLDAGEVVEIFEDVPSSEIEKSRLGGEGMWVVDLVAATKVAPSKSEARRLVQGGGVYLNNRRLTDLEHRVSLEESIEGKFLVIRKGQKHYHLVRIV
jgi:tyrosyl-tRNA synthetase